MRFVSVNRIAHRLSIYRARREISERFESRWICFLFVSALLAGSLSPIASSDGCSFKALAAEAAARAAGQEYQKAARVGELAAECAEREYGKTSKEYGEIEALLGSVYLSLGTPELAEASFLSATIILRKYPSENRLRQDVSYGLSSLYNEQEKAEDAEAVLEESIKITEGHFGPKHPDLVRDLNSLAMLHFARGKVTDAIPLLERAHKIVTSAPVPNDSAVFKSTEFLSNLFMRDKRCPEAVRLLSESIAALDSAGTSSDRRIGRLYMLLGSAYTTMGNSAGAYPGLRKALAIAKACYSSDDPWLMIYYVRLAECCVKLDSVAQADTLYDWAMRIGLNASSVPSGMNIASYARDYASLLRRMGQTDKAQEIEEKASNLKVHQNR